MMEYLNYIDIAALIVTAFYVVVGVRRGVWILSSHLIAFLLSIIIAFLTYRFVGRLLVDYFDSPPAMTYAIGFIIVFIVARAGIGFLFGRMLQALPRHWHTARASKILAILPASVDAFIFIALLIFVITVLPFPAQIKQDVSSSATGYVVVQTISRGEAYAREVFGDAFEEAVTFFTINPESEERVAIPYRPRSLSIDEMTEVKMLELINEERARVGARPLVMDQTLVEVARLHSRDMWERGYFSHQNPDGESPFDRMRRGNVEYITAGENLAFAPTLGLAHRGLMNSHGHKRNILDPNFGRIGIGVIEGGMYGKMFTQKFTD